MSIERRCWPVCARFAGLNQRGLDDSGEMNHGGPLSFAVSLPDEVAVQQGRDFGWGEIAMEVEVLCGCGLVASRQVDLTWRRALLGLKKQGSVVTPWIRGGLPGPYLSQ